MEINQQFESSVSSFLFLFRVSFFIFLILSIKSSSLEKESSLVCFLLFNKFINFSIFTYVDFLLFQSRKIKVFSLFSSHFLHLFPFLFFLFYTIILLERNLLTSTKLLFWRWWVKIVKEKRKPTSERKRENKRMTTIIIFFFSIRIYHQSILISDDQISRTDPSLTLKTTWKWGENRKNCWVRLVCFGIKKKKTFRIDRVLFSNGRALKNARNR